MANLEQYSDEHRIFLQGIMSKGILNAEEVHSLLRMACGRCKVETPVDRPGKLEKLKKFIITINKELGDLGLEIRKALDEDSYTREAYFVLCNNYDRSDELSQLTCKAMVDFSRNEMEYFKLLLDSLLRSENKEISPTEALNCANYVQTFTPSRKFTQKDGEMAIKKFIDSKWLKYDSPQQQSQIRLSAKFLAEMTPYLRDIRNKYIEQNKGLEDGPLEIGKGIGHCQLCSHIVVRSIDCPSCGVNYHLYCIFSIASETRRELGRCIACKGDVPIPIGRNLGPNQTKHRKRKHQ